MGAEAKSLIANAWTRFTMLKLHASTKNTSAFVNSKISAIQNSPNTSPPLF